MHSEPPADSLAERNQGRKCPRRLSWSPDFTSAPRRLMPNSIRMRGYQARPNERGIPEAIRVEPSTISFYFLLQFVPNRFGQMQQRAAVIALVEYGQHFLAQTIRLFVGEQRLQAPADREAILPIGIGEKKQPATIGVFAPQAQAIAHLICEILGRKALKQLHGPD